MSHIPEPTARSTVVGDHLVQVGQVWVRKKDSKQVEVVWMRGSHSSLPYDRVQLRAAGAVNMKNTHWIDAWNLPLLYTLRQP